MDRRQALPACDRGRTRPLPRQARGRHALAIQVDGGSKFMADFEEACHKRSITVYVLPPKSTELYGAVERCNSSRRCEFSAVYDLPTRIDDLNPLIDAFQHRYKHHRPHDALGGNTPPSPSPSQGDCRLSHVLSADSQFPTAGDSASLTVS
jgi:transposase InsO family protein